MTKQQKVLKNSKRAWAASLCLLLACILNAPAYAADTASKQIITYDVYAGGIHAVEATLTIDIKDPSKDRYSLVLDAHTRGFLGTVAPWNGTFETHGWGSKNGNYRPEQHKSTSDWKGEVEIKDYAYGKNGQFKSLTIDDHDKPPEVKDIEKEITDSTTDALTATLLVLENYNQTQTCDGSSKVFDGKRSFDQIFTHEENVTLQASKYNVYEGDAAKCVVEVKPLKGKWHKKPRGWLSIQEQGRDRGTMPTVWVASMDENAPAIPVKIFVKTAYGNLFMHLSEYQNGDTVLMTERRAKAKEE